MTRQLFILTTSFALTALTAFGQTGGSVSTIIIANYYCRSVFLPGTTLVLYSDSTYSCNYWLDISHTRTDKGTFVMQDSSITLCSNNYNLSSKPRKKQSVHFKNEKYRMTNNKILLYTKEEEKSGNYDFLQNYSTFYLQSSVFGQTTDSLTTDFKLDSLGCNGLRAKHMKDVAFDKIRKRPIGTVSDVQVLFDGKSILGKSKEEVILLLGHPNWSSTPEINKSKEKFSINYFTTTCGGKNPGTSLVIFLINNKVTDTGFVIHD